MKFQLIKGNGEPTAGSSRYLRLVGIVVAVALGYGLIVLVGNSRDHETTWSIPVELVRGSLFAPCTVQNNDEVRYFLVDTGASASAVSQDLANELRHGARARYRGVAEKEVMSNHVDIDILRLGPVEIKKVRALVEKGGGKLFADMDLKVSGILGNDVLSRYRLTLDYPRKTIYLMNAMASLVDQRPRSPQAVEMKVEWKDGQLLIPLQVEDRTLPFILDTGAQSTLIDEGVAKSLGLADQKGEMDLVDSTGEMIRGKKVLVPTMALSTIALENVTILSVPKRGEDDPRRALGILGGDILSKYVVTIDYVMRKVYLEP